MGIVVKSARRHEATVLVEALGTIRLAGQRGRPRTRPGEVVGDGAYDSQDIREELRRRGIRACIPENPRGRRRPRVGRPHHFVLDTYRVLRSAVERFFAWLKGGFRRLALCHERLLATFQGFVHLACFLITWRVLR